MNEEKNRKTFTLKGDSVNSTSFFTEMFDWLSSVFSAVLCFIIVFTLFARIVMVDGDSMLDTLHNGERLIVSDFLYTPQYGDIVILYADKLYNSATEEYGKPIVKRVIGLPGDKIRIDFTEGVVYRNGEALEEDYTYTPTNLPEDFPDNTDVTIDDGKVFVLGDNRNGSKDSRSSDIGQIDQRYIIGKAILRMWPFSKFGMV